MHVAQLIRTQPFQLGSRSRIRSFPCANPYGILTLLCPDVYELRTQPPSIWRAYLALNHVDRKLHLSEDTKERFLHSDAPSDVPHEQVQTTNQTAERLNQTVGREQAPEPADVHDGKIVEGQLSGRK